MKPTKLMYNIVAMAMVSSAAAQDASQPWDGIKNIKCNGVHEAVKPNVGSVRHNSEFNLKVLFEKGKIKDVVGAVRSQPDISVVTFDDCSVNKIYPNVGLSQTCSILPNTAQGYYVQRLLEYKDVNTGVKYGESLQKVVISADAKKVTALWIEKNSREPRTDGMIMAVDASCKFE